jgi:hypothetical protein
MTEQQKQHAADVLVKNSMMLLGSTAEEPKFLPKVFVVNGKCYWFLNVARRAAFGTEHPIEVMTIADAWEIHLHLPADTLRKECVDSNFDQTGDTYYDSRLFDDRNSITTSMVPNPVIKYVSDKADLSAVADMPVNRMFLGVRAQNILMKLGCKTYGDALKHGRETISKLRNVGATTLSELDAEFDRVGLWNQWKYNKPIA